MARSTRSAYGLAFSGNRPTVAMSVDTTLSGVKHSGAS
mgnify:CR=1